MSIQLGGPDRETRIVRLLQSKTLSISVAESLTVGLVQAKFGSVSGLSSVFAGGVTAYDRAAKVQLLGVSSLHAKSVDCFSQRVAVEMARGVCELFRSDVGIATTGFAEGVTPEAWIALSHGSLNLSWRVPCPGLARDAVREAVAHQLLGRLEDYLHGLP